MLRLEFLHVVDQRLDRSKSIPRGFHEEALLPQSILIHFQDERVIIHQQ